MRTIRFAYRQLHGLKAVIFMLGLLAYILIGLHSGAPWYTVPLCALAAVVYILLPGCLFLRLFEKNWKPGPMRGPVSLLLGGVYLCFAYLPAVRLWQGLLHLLVLPVAAISFVLWLREIRRGRMRIEASTPALWNLLALLGIVLAVSALALCVPNALPSAVGANAIHQDILWNAGNAASLKNSFPPWDIRFMGIRLQYHFFTDLLTAIFSMLTGLSCYVVSFCGLQPLLLAALLVSLYGCGMALFKNNGKALLFILLLFSACSGGLFFTAANGQDAFGNTFIYHLLTNINAQTTATLCCAVFAGLYLPLLRGEGKMLLPRAALCLLAFGVFCVAKGPEAAIAACAALVAGLFCLIQKKRRVWPLVLGGLLFGIFLISYLLLYSAGAESSMVLSIRGTLGQGLFAPLASFDIPAYAAQWLLLALHLLLVLPLPLFCAAYSFFTAWRRKGLRGIDPAQFLCFTAGIGGLVAYGIFTHNSYSQVYFLFAAVFFLCVLCADSLPALLQKEKGVRPAGVVAGLLLAITVVGAASSYGRLAATGARALRQPGADALTQAYTPADEGAALWLRNNTPPGTIFATNRIHSGPQHKGVSNFFSALSERQAHMEGFTYVQTNMGIPEDMLLDHILANAALFDEDSTAEEILAIAQARGITYLVYCEGSEGSRSQLEAFELVYEDEGTAVFQLY